MISINKQKLYKSFISIGRSTRKKRLIYEKFRTRQQFSLFRIVNSTDDEKRKQTFAHACVSSGDPLRIFCILKQFVNLDCCRYQISFGYVLIKECLAFSRVIAHVSLLNFWNKKTIYWVVWFLQNIFWNGSQNQVPKPCSYAQLF